MKVFTGKIIAANQPKTVKVLVERFVTHPLYQKRLRRRKVYMVHDESGSKVGDVVKFVACRPMSHMKRWKILEKETK